jgi:hypothetical protein
VLDWFPIAEAKPDGTVCRLLLRDALGTYQLPGTYFLHDDGFWYSIERAVRVTSPPYKWRPVFEDQHEPSPSHH